MVDYLLDTNHASKLMAREEPLSSRVQQAQQAGDRFTVSSTVVGELFHGVYLSQRREQNRQRLQALLHWLQIFPFDTVAAEMFGQIQAELRSAGRPIRPLDAQIAAVARAHNLVILTRDHHFDHVRGISVEDWLG